MFKENFCNPKDDDFGGDGINDFVREAIDEATGEAIKDAIEEALIEEGIDATPELVEKGFEMLTREETGKVEIAEEAPAETRTHHGPAPKSGGIHVKDDAPKDKEFCGPKGPIAPITKRERLEAAKEGLLMFIQEEQKILEEKVGKSEDGTSYLPDSERFYHEKKIERAQEKIGEIEKEISGLPQTEKFDMKNIPEWMRDHALAEQRNKDAALERIKDTCAQGMETNNKWGMEAIGEISDQHDQLIHEARKKSEEAFG